MPNYAGSVKTAEVITHIDDALEQAVPAKLLSETVYVAILELRAEENVLRKVNLNANASVLLEVVRASHGRRITATNGDPNALVLKDGESGVGASDSALESQGKVLVVDRHVEAIEVVEFLTILERTVIALDRFKVEFPTDPKVFAEHSIAFKAHEEAAEGGIWLAGGIRG